MREKAIEGKLIQAVRQNGGLALKFLSPNFNGVPDRLLLFPGGKAAFVEVKAPGQKPRPLQEHRIAQLRALGFKVYVLDSVNQISALLADLPSKEESVTEEVRGDEPLTTAGGGNFVRGESGRNERSPQCGAATIEATGKKAPQKGVPSEI